MASARGSAGMSTDTDHGNRKGAIGWVRGRPVGPASPSLPLVAVVQGPHAAPGGRHGEEDTASPPSGPLPERAGSAAAATSSEGCIRPALRSTVHRPLRARPSLRPRWPAASPGPSWAWEDTAERVSCVQECSTYRARAAPAASPASPWCSCESKVSRNHKLKQTLHLNAAQLSSPFLLSPSPPRAKQEEKHQAELETLTPRASAPPGFPAAPLLV